MQCDLLQILLYAECGAKISFIAKNEGGLQYSLVFTSISAASHLCIVRLMEVYVSIQERPVLAVAQQN